jgi:hypothetical protein
MTTQHTPEDISIVLEQIEGEDEWYFLNYKDIQKSHFRERMTILCREDGWIGLQIRFPWTHETALDNLIQEVELAKRAIKMIKEI